MSSLADLVKGYKLQPKQSFTEYKERKKKRA